MRLAVALIPDDYTITCARGLNDAIRQFGSKISLHSTDEAGNLPHVSLTHAPIEEAEAEALMWRIIANLPRRRRVPTAMMTTITTRFDEWVFWDAKPDATFYDVLGWVLNAVNEQRGDRRVEVSWPLSPTQQSAYELYGYPNTGGAIEPHITLGLIDKDQMPDGFRRGIEDIQQASFGKLVIATVGPYGTLARILAEHQF